MEGLSKSLTTGEYDLYRSLLDLPCRIEPRGGGTAYTLTTEAELKRDFDLYHKALTLNRVTDVYRTLIALQSTDPEAFSARATTHLLGSAGRVVDPFETEFEIHWKDDSWRVKQVRSVLGHINWALGRSTIDSGRFSKA